MRSTIIVMKILLDKSSGITGLGMTALNTLLHTNILIGILILTYCYRYQSIDKVKL